MECVRYSKVHKLKIIGEDGRMESQIASLLFKNWFSRGNESIMRHAKPCCITQSLLKCSSRVQILSSSTVAGVCFHRA